MLICIMSTFSLWNLFNLCQWHVFLLVLFSLLLYVRLVRFVVAVGAPILYYNNSQDNSSVAQAVDVKIAIKMFTPKMGQSWGRAG